MTTLSRNNILVVFSGGQDSTTCLFDALRRARKSRGIVDTITFNYGQRHQRELQAATDIVRLARHLYSDVFGRHEVVNLPQGVLHSTSPLVSDAELEQYADHKSLPGGIEKTFVPLRNQLFLTLAANRAVELGAGVIVTGVCQEDSGGYPDCRQTFITALESAINESLGIPHGIQIVTPLMNMTKAESVKLAGEMPSAMVALAYSHTAYDGQYPPTGKDHATLLREKGFAEAGVTDPLWVRALVEGYDPEVVKYHLRGNWRDQLGGLAVAQAALATS